MCIFFFCLLVVCVSQIRPNLRHTLDIKFIPLNNKINLNFRLSSGTFFLFCAYMLVTRLNYGLKIGVPWVIKFGYIASKKSG